ncbi:hypothetical protein ACFGVR_22990 [Mucilaginibacter sp. AW1-3]
MENIKEVSWKNEDGQLNNDVLRRHRDEDIRDDDAITSDRVADSKLPGSNADEDDANLRDNDITGRDLDVENRDEWDAGNVGDDLDRADLDDDDEINADKHRVKKDQFGSLAQTIKNEGSPDPDEMPEEHEIGNGEVEQPNQGGVEHGENNEADYEHTKEVTPPQPEHHRDATLTDLDPTNVGVEHTRTTERMVDHEPGVAGDRRAPNL